ncbi:diguanylate cyclase [Cupriavidus sp. UYPR2.512]|uniref:diguanylate cyclase n=1 Tax=Cupriavidus sp. UYPR2.512 TaxID=1080187 RepID=UPI00037287C6|nr:diguanylate cyclase [Cupriavidus sp. UYPR2.512]UIF84564.1 diguanylate cyclase [Cupriavidus necator]
MSFSLTFLDECEVVNDTFEHNASDTVLREMADRLRESLVGVKLIPRFGGSVRPPFLQGSVC